MNSLSSFLKNWLRVSNKEVYCDNISLLVNSLDKSHSRIAIKMKISLQALQGSVMIFIYFRSLFSQGNVKKVLKHDLAHLSNTFDNPLKNI